MHLTIIKTYLGWKESGLDICDYLIKGDIVDKRLIEYLIDRVASDDISEYYLLMYAGKERNSYMLFRRIRCFWRYYGLIKQEQPSMQLAC